MAYFLSLYPSVTFNPERSSFTDLPSTEQHTFSSMYRIVRAALPEFIHNLLPSPAIIEAMAPVPPKPLSSDELKDAILAIASRDKITGQLPKGTPNLLIFNNATTS
jgi:cerevisin